MLYRDLPPLQVLHLDRVPVIFGKMLFLRYSLAEELRDESRLVQLQTGQESVDGRRVFRLDRAGKDQLQKLSVRVFFQYLAPVLPQEPLTRFAMPQREDA